MGGSYDKKNFRIFTMAIQKIYGLASKRFTWEKR